jgi:LacI family transcriptional regulator/LacI family repressor for deo operon, udp, cdd, tsx, nupC, and nupG
MQALAGELGLSRLTVSSVVNGQAAARGISAATAARVQAYLRQRGFVPSRTAVRLRSGQPGGVGLLYCGRLYSHLVEAFNLMAHHFSQQPGGVELMVVPREKLVAGWEDLVARRVSALVWVHTLTSEIELAERETLKGLASGLQTVVIYNYHFNAPQFDQEVAADGFHLVGVSRAAAYARLAAFLHQLGHRRVMLPDVVGGIPGKGNQEFANAFIEHGLQIFGPEPGKARSMDIERMAGWIRDALKKHGVTAACLRDDEMTGLVMAALRARGIRIPEDLTLTGFDGLGIGAAFTVPLTTLAMPVKTMVQRVYDLVAGKSRGLQNIFLMELLKRESHGKV